MLDEVEKARRLAVLGESQVKVEQGRAVLAKVGVSCEQAPVAFPNRFHPVAGHAEVRDHEAVFAIVADLSLGQHRKGDLAGPAGANFDTRVANSGACMGQCRGFGRETPEDEPTACHASRDLAPSR